VLEPFDQNDGARAVSLCYKTNVAVCQSYMQSVRLSPVADFMFLKDLSRAASATTRSARQ
jgi:hypothetical protein